MLVVPGTADTRSQSVENIYTIAGIGNPGGFGDSGDGGQATEAQIDQPRSVTQFAGDGYAFAEPFSEKIRIVQSDGIVSTLAGTGVQGYSGDGGPATEAQLDTPHAIVPMAGGGYVIADAGNDRIRRILGDGTITTFAGTGIPGYTGDGGPATDARIRNPRSVSALTDGTVFITDSDNNCIRKVDTAGVITTIAGGPNSLEPPTACMQTGSIDGEGGDPRDDLGDGGPATSATLNIPFCAVPTADGGLLICDVNNQRIRKIDGSGNISTVAGTGFKTGSIDGPGGDPRDDLNDNGPAVDASLAFPHAVATLPDGGFLIVDTSNQRVRRVWPDGSITTIAGDGTKSFGGDGGPATSAQLDSPKGVAVDASGNVYIADEQNSRIRFVGTPVAPANVSLPTVSGTPQAGQTLTGTTGGWSGTGPTFTYQWRRCDGGGNCTDITNANAKTYQLGPGDIGWRIRFRVTASNAAGSASADSAPTAVVSGNPTAVTVASFAASRANGSVRLRWRTAQEAGLLGFQIYRATAQGRVPVTRGLIPVRGRLTGRRYSWLDRRAPHAATRYWLHALLRNGAATWIGPAQAAAMPVSRDHT